MSEYFQMIIWILAALFFLGWLFNLRKDAKKGNIIHIVTIIQTTLFLLVLIFFEYSSSNKLNLLWIIPLCLPVGLITGFLLLQIPIVGTLLRIFFLFFARIFLIGIGGEIKGVPYGK